MKITKEKQRKNLAKYLPPQLNCDAVIVRGTQVLMMKRNHSPYSGYWVVPGGHVDMAEHPKDAILREVKEEIGVKIRVRFLLGLYQGPDSRAYTISAVYVATIASGTAKVLEESSEIRWFDMNHLPTKIGFAHQRFIQDTRKALQKGFHEA